MGNSLSFPALSLKHCFIRGRVLPLLLQASKESVLQALVAGAAEGAAADILPQWCRTQHLARMRSTQRDHEHVPDPPHRGFWVPAGPMAVESVAPWAGIAINSAYAGLMQRIGSAGPGPSCCSELPNCPGSRGAALIYTINTSLLQTATCIVQYFRPIQWSYMEACQGYLFICTHKPEIYNSL